jgi:hypothetical protein
MPLESVLQVIDWFLRPLGAIRALHKPMDVEQCRGSSAQIIRLLEEYKRHE